MTNHLYITLFLVTISSVIIYLFLNSLKRCAPPLYYMLLVCFGCHLILMTFMLIDINSRYDPFVTKSRFYNDGETYASNAWLISKTLKGEVPERSFFYTVPGIQYVLNETFSYAQNMQIPPTNQYQVGFISYIYGVIFASIGFLPGFINFINIIFHLAGGTTLFFLCRDVCNKKTGYIACFLYLFNPILFYYATTKLKEAMYIWAVILFLYSLVLLAKKRWIWVVPGVILFLLITAIKPVYYYPLTAVTVIYITWLSIMACKRILFFIVPLLGYICFAYYDNILHRLHTVFNKALYHNFAYIHSGGKVYSLLVFGENYKSYSMPQKITSLFYGWYHMIAEPLIGKNLSGKFILFLPVKIIWIVLTLSAVLGLGMSLRQKPKETVLFVFFLVLIGSVIAAGSGNIGTMIRHRDVISPVIFMFGSYYISTLFCGLCEDNV